MEIGPPSGNNFKTWCFLFKVDHSPPFEKENEQYVLFHDVKFPTFYNDKEDFCKFADDVQFWGVVDTPNGDAVIQKNLNRLEK